MPKPRKSLSETVADLPGVERLEGLIDGRFASPTMDETLNYRLVAVAPGEVTLTARPSRAVLNPFGTVHGGYMASVLDSALGYAVYSTLAAGESCTTLEFKINLTRPVRPDDPPLTATARVVTRGRRVAVSEAQLMDGEGRIVAIATSTYLVFAEAS